MATSAPVRTGSSPPAATIATGSSSLYGDNQRSGSIAGVSADRRPTNHVPSASASASPPAARASRTLAAINMPRPAKQTPTAAAPANSEATSPASTGRSATAASTGMATTASASGNASV